MSSTNNKNANTTTNQKSTVAYINNSANSYPHHHHPSQLPQLQLQHLQQQKSHTNHNHISSQLLSPTSPASGGQNSASLSSQTQKQPGHLVPPRYQPPPQPPGGILKNISTTKSSGIPTLNHHSPHSSDPNTSAHLNIKYPPEVPKLTTVYIPDSVRSTGNPSRIATARSLQQQRQSLNSIQQQQHQQQHSQHSSQQPSPQSIHLTADDEQQSSASRAHQQEMLKFVRKSDTEPVANSANVQNPSSSSNHMRMASAEQNRHFQSLIAELRSLKEANQRLSDDNQELRDLCCFLDDDRQKGRKLAREWQRFGRYTASVMRQEVSAYQNKLRQLDDKQQELIRDNLELKELCLYLDEERANVTASIPTSCTNCGAPVRLTASTSSGALRDDGDGSSSSTNDEPMPTLQQFDRSIPELNIRSTLSDQTLQYVRSLERRILEHELATNNGVNGIIADSSTITANVNSNNNMNNNTNTSTNSNSKIGSTANANVGSNEIVSGRPEAVVRALQILEVREQLERDRAGHSSSISPEHMDDGEKALLREMCNVVWRKLEENPNGPSLDPL